MDRGPNFFPDEYFSLEQQLVAQRIRLDIHQSVFDISNRSCWSLMLLGCTFKEGMFRSACGYIPAEIINIC